MEYYEVKRVAGLNKEELTGKLPLKGRRTTCSIRIHATGHNGSRNCPVVQTRAFAPVGSRWLNMGLEPCGAKERGGAIPNEETGTL
eukprot:4798811-Pyramimonas_sp.AAC.1